MRTHHEVWEAEIFANALQSQFVVRSTAKQLGLSRCLRVVAHLNLPPPSAEGMALMVHETLWNACCMLGKGEKVTDIFLVSSNLDGNMMTSVTT